MFPLKAAFTPKDSSRWFAFNSRLQGATPSSWPELSLEQEGALGAGLGTCREPHTSIVGHGTRASLSWFRPAKILTPLQS